ncbi:MAG: C-terminal binding protein [Methylobacteriaceae bacterium]|jgi:D-3-phosphoglycerate dehydrogenase|nr:C-terminal binding protein [Methylobacteriaceae bacterium]
MKIVVSDCDHENLAQEEQILGAAGLPFTLLKCRTEEETIRDCKGAELVMNQYAPFTRKVIEALRPELKQIVRYGVGVNNIDVAAATDNGVLVCNVPDYGMNEVSDHGIALMMALVRKIPEMNARTHAGEWDYQKSIPIYRLGELTVGVIGLGRIGRLFAKKAAVFGSRILGYDLVYKPNAADGTDFINPASIDEIIGSADIIAVFAPLTPETKDMFDEAAFKKMKKTALLINTSRGGIVNEAALAKALEAGEIAGAALDVAEKEPLPADSPLRAYANCLLTPHMAWYSEQAGKELKRKVAEEIVRFARGEPVHYPLNKVK